MTIEERLERLEHTVFDAVPIKRPVVGSSFWLRAATELWHMWLATHNGIVAIDGEMLITDHSWATFDKHVGAGHWTVEEIESP